MKLLVSRQWLRDRIATDPDIETDSGAALAVLEDFGVIVPPLPQQTVGTIAPDQTVTQLRIALGTLMRQLRIKQRLSVAELARQASVDEDEIHGIERDPHFAPRPRTLHNLAQYHKLPIRQVIMMSGATRTVDRSFFNEAVRFAASSDDVSQLSSEELQGLYAFVKFLSDRDKP
jgi:transcriptional regulator with XRE-family HTH domain